jgi:hypothetical protein
MNVRLRHVLSHLHGVSGLRVPYRMNYEEIYQTDVLNLPAEVTYAHNLPVNSPTLSATPSSSATGLGIACRKEIAERITHHRPVAERKSRFAAVGSLASAEH